MSHLVVLTRTDRTEAELVAAVRLNPDRLVHWIAVVTAVVSLAPIAMGSLVTTLGAGMAFPDWPTSDGQGMLAYPWLSSSGDRFVEHGHRLAGVLIGLCATVLCVTAVVTRRNVLVQFWCGVALGGVVIQGLLGGLRVRIDEQVMAFAHSVFGCLVFVSLWFTAVVTSGRWSRAVNDSCQAGKALSGLGLVFPVLCLAQYVLGGFIRHLGMMVHEHVAGAVIVTVATAVVVWMSLQQENPRVRGASVVVGLMCLLQVLVGLAVWVSKFGLPPAGWVAVQHSMFQVVARTVHTVGGMAVVASAVYWSVSVMRCSVLHDGRQSGVGCQAAE